MNLANLIDVSTSSVQLLKNRNNSGGEVLPAKPWRTRIGKKRIHSEHWTNVHPKDGRAIPHLKNDELSLVQRLIQLTVTDPADKEININTHIRKNMQSRNPTFIEYVKFITAIIACLLLSG